MHPYIEAQKYTLNTYESIADGDDSFVFKVFDLTLASELGVGNPICLKRYKYRGETYFESLSIYREAGLKVLRMPTQHIQIPNLGIHEVIFMPTKIIWMDEKTSFSATDFVEAQNIETLISRGEISNCDWKQIGKPALEELNHNVHKFLVENFGIHGTKISNVNIAPKDGYAYVTDIGSHISDFKMF